MEPDVARPRRTVQYRRCCIALAVGLVPLGLGIKAWAPGGSWLHAHAAGMLYVTFWCFGFAGLRPTWSPAAIAWAVLAATCGLEWLQLWQPAWLQALRRTWLGQVLIGGTFSWLDLPHYVAGALVGWALLRGLARLETVRE